MKNILTLLLAVLALTACSSDNDETPVPADTDKSVFLGTLNVSPQAGSPFNAFTASDIEFDLRAEEDGHWTLVMPKIKFVEQMPVWIAFEVRDLRPEQTADGFRFAIDRTLPYWNGAPYDPDGDGKYEITDLTGDCNGSGKLHVTFRCYSMLVDYRGDWSAASAEIPLP